MTLTVGSLFSGIGGIDLGLERAGMRVIWQSEIDPYACRVLAKHWPNVPNLGDITKIDWSKVEQSDLICGGYPCQPFSFAGVRRGEADPRHLWPRFRDAIRHLRPRWALLENVPGHLSLGFGRVVGDLAELGYDCEWDCIPAAAVGAPHLRYRVFVVAHSDQHSKPSRTLDAVTGSSGKLVAHTDQPGPRDGRSEAGGWGIAGSRGAVADTDELAGATRSRERATGPMGKPGTIKGALGRSGVRLGGTWTVEPDVGRVADGVPSRVDRLRCLGNAVVPQVAEWVGRRILEAAV